MHTDFFALARVSWPFPSLRKAPWRDCSATDAIRARAEMRLAEEYDDAQERGEIKANGGNRTVDIPNSADLGLRRDEIHEARKLRDAEQESPALIARFAFPS